MPDLSFQNINMEKMNYFVLEKKSIFVENNYNLLTSIRPRDDLYRN